MSLRTGDGQRLRNRPFFSFFFFFQERGTENHAAEFESAPRLARECTKKKRVYIRVLVYNPVPNRESRVSAETRLPMCVDSTHSARIRAYCRERKQRRKAKPKRLRERETHTHTHTCTHWEFDGHGSREDTMRTSATGSLFPVCGLNCSSARPELVRVGRSANTSTSSSSECEPVVVRCLRILLFSSWHLPLCLYPNSIPDTFS